MLRRLCALSLFSLCLYGCDPVALDTTLSRQVTDAINEIDEFNKVVDRTPDNLRVAAEKVVDKLQFAGEDVLANDARQFADHTLGSGGAVAKGLMEYADAKMRAYLDALKIALEEALPKIQAETSKERALELLRNIKVDVQPLDPFVELVTPNKLTYNVFQTYQGGLKGVEYASPKIIEFSGFGFLRPDGEVAEYQIQVAGVDGTRLLPETSLSQAGPFILLLNLSHFKPVAGDTKLLVTWGRKKLADIPIEVNVIQDPQPAPPPPRIVAVLATVNTTDDDKDREVSFNYTIHHKDSGDVSRGGLTTGHGEVWSDDPDDNRTFRIDLEPGREFLEPQKNEYLLRATYSSSDGDPKWEGKIHAVGVKSNGEIVPLLNDTGVFPMGHLGDGSDRAVRHFPFNAPPH